MKCSKFNILSEYTELFQAVFLRHGGVSSGSFASLNVGMNIGDSETNVVKNREIVKKEAAVSSLLFF